MEFSGNHGSPLQAWPGAVLHCADRLRRKELSLLAEECGFEVIQAGNDPAATLGGEGAGGAPQVLLIDFTSITDPQAQEISNITSYLKTSSAEALIWTDLDRLDVAYALLPASRCHFLVDASDAEAMLILTRANRRGRMDQLHDNSRDDGFGDLHKISDELAGFAKTLAKIAEQDDGEADAPGNALSDKPVSFRPAPAAALSPFIEEPKPASMGWSAKDIQNLIRLRRMRETFFDADLFADPAWDILLDLMAARMDGKNVSVSSLCIAAAVPATTALRWITGMTQNGMLIRQLDPDDARRVFIELSPDTVQRLERYLTEISTRGPVV
ncbi:MAG: MarR family winged helix-turn-helix transcriptional regulator [Sphingorhabdus sp.]